MKTVCITGHRPKGFPWKYNDRYSIEQLIYLQELRKAIGMLALSGYSHFISGGAIGVDLDFAKIVLDIRKDLPITLEIAIPCPQQDLKWNANDKKKYESIIEKADKVSLISEKYTPYCMQKRNEYMVDNSNIVLAGWNGEERGGTWNTISYAKKLGKPMTIILLNEIAKAEKEFMERNWPALCDKLGFKK